MRAPPHAIITVGVSGSGKTTVAEALAKRLGWSFIDGDAFHPPANVEKMRSGTPLTDDDRWPWLSSLATALHEAADAKGVAVGACSALKRSYRDYLLKEAGEPILFVFLDGTEELIASRMATRTHEYMPLTLLASQFATLEVPGPDENVLTVPITLTVEQIAERVMKAVPHLKAFKRKQ